MVLLFYDRVVFSRVFLFMGIDYVGFLLFKLEFGRGIRIKKVWMILFICFLVKVFYI